MKLSEAIRLGAMLRPQAFGNAFNDGKSCAIGAAYEASGLATPGSFTGFWDYEWSEVVLVAFPLMDTVLETPCPACGLVGYSANDSGSVSHLNDVHRWTREQIADWVQTIEDAHAAKSEQPVAAEVIA